MVSPTKEPMPCRCASRLTLTPRDASMLSRYRFIYLSINITDMLGGWVNPHRKQQTIPQGQTLRPPKSFFTLTAKARPDQAAFATSAEARGATHRARPRSPSRGRWMDG